jgi:hypothetical protein
VKEAGGKALLQLIERCLHEGAVIDIDGMGSFELDAKQEIVFKATGKGRVFLAYAQEDATEVKKLYAALQRAGFDPWMDKEKLLPGQNWPRAIERAIELADYFVGCFSRRSVSKRGHFQSELAYALDASTKVPQEQMFFVPVRLDNCEMPRLITDTTHYVDLFPNWNQGMKKLVKSLRSDHRGRLPGS